MPAPQIPKPEIPGSNRQWCAVYTSPQHGKSPFKHLTQRGVDAFYPTFVREIPSYLFVRKKSQQRGLVLEGADARHEGALVRRKNSLWFVISIYLIDQRAMVEVKADDIEPVQA